MRCATGQPYSCAFTQIHLTISDVVIQMRQVGNDSDEISSAYTMQGSVKSYLVPQAQGGLKCFPLATLPFSPDPYSS